MPKITRTYQLKLRRGRGLCVGIADRQIPRFALMPD
jgi:hypothetical protein